MSIPDTFISTINDFTNDLTTTFPEYSHLWNKWRTNETSIDEYNQLFEYCVSVYPERFFDVLYQNNDIYELESKTNTFFLPNVDFKLLWNCEGVTDNTKSTIWKYLQLILFMIVGSVKDKSTFGESANLFDGVDENELYKKMEETMGGLTDFFKTMGLDEMSGENNKTGNNGEKEASGEEQEQKFTFEKTEGMPNMENIQNHLKGLFEGKIGKLAKELAEEISKDFEHLLDDEMNDGNHSTQDILKKMMKNPKKMMDLVKKVGDKLKHKMDSGDISKDELMKEATDLMNKMKEMGGASEFQNMFKEFAAGMGKGARIDTNALSRMSKMEAMKSRMRERVGKKKENFVLEPTSVPNNYVYREEGGEVQERSSAIQKAKEDELIAMFGNQDTAKTTKPESKKKGKNGKKGKK